VLREFKKHIDLKFQNLLEAPFLLACSGGVDSVVLVHMCSELQLDFSVAHCNFKLRGAASDADEAFVKDLAISLNKRCFSRTFDTIGYINTQKVSLQVAARELRYAWFSKILEENKIATVVTAHQADDNLETFLINLSRGTGIEGLTSIPEKTAAISRPLLPFSRDEILGYAQEHRLGWREDQSNKETKYLRNKIRHTIVPNLKELHPNFLNNFLKTQAFLGQTASLLAIHIEALRNAIFKKEKDILKIEIVALEKLNPLETYIYQLFRPYGFHDAQAIISLFGSLSGKELVSPTHRILKDRNFFLVQEIKESTPKFYEIKKGEKSMLYPIHLEKEVVLSMDEIAPNCLYVDAKTLTFPLIVRKAKIGDYFYPFGMQGKKKLSKFFKDEKYSQFDKENQWLLCSEKNIVWVIGKRIDNRFIISPKTKEIIKFTLYNE